MGDIDSSMRWRFDKNVPWSKARHLQILNNEGTDQNESQLRLERFSQLDEFVGSNAEQLEVRPHKEENIFENTGSSTVSNKRNHKHKM